MPIKTFRPITPTLRFQTTLVNDDITTDKPHKPLLVSKQRTGGRRNSGDMTMRHHGGGEGKTSGGRHPVTPWGQPTRGYKTRNNKRTDAFIVGRRTK